MALVILSVVNEYQQIIGYKKLNRRLLKYYEVFVRFQVGFS